MNKNRRLEISKLHDAMENLISKLEDLRDQEQEYYDNMPESLKSGDKGDISQTHIDNLDESISNLQEAVSLLSETFN